MNPILTVGFEFHEIFYYSLISVKQTIEDTEYRITVMNGNLEKMLFGHNIIKEINHRLYMETSEGAKYNELKLKIAEALSCLLNMPLEKELNNKIY